MRQGLCRTAGTRGVDGQGEADGSGYRGGRHGTAHGQARVDGPGSSGSDCPLRDGPSSYLAEGSVGVRGSGGCVRVEEPSGVMADRNPLHVSPFSLPLFLVHQSCFPHLRSPHPYVSVLSPHPRPSP